MRRSASDLAFLYIREAAAQEKKMETSPESKPAEETSTTVKVFVHDSSFSSEELLVSPTAFPDVQNNSVVFVDFSTKNNESARVVLRATLMKDEDETTKSKRFALSLLKPVAEAFDVAPWADASVEPCNDPANEAAAEYVEFMFKVRTRRVTDVLRHRRVSSPADEVVGGLFFDFGPVRTASWPSKSNVSIHTGPVRESRGPVAV